MGKLCAVEEDAVILSLFVNDNYVHKAPNLDGFITVGTIVDY